MSDINRVSSVKAYLVTFVESNVYLVIHCFSDLKQAEIMKGIYEKTGLTATIEETEIEDFPYSESVPDILSKDLYKVVHYTLTDKKDIIEKMGVDQMLSHMGVGTNRIFSVVETGSGFEGDSSITVFVHADSKRDAYYFSLSVIVGLLKEDVKKRFKLGEYYDGEDLPFEKHDDRKLSDFVDLD